MSFLTYIYPSEPQLLTMDKLSKLLIKEHFKVEEYESKPRLTPDWSYLLLSHSSLKNLRFKFVVARNKKDNIEWVTELYSGNRNLETVRTAKKYIWSEILSGKATNRELNAGFAYHDAVLYMMARLSKGVIDLPENNSLYSSSGFARYLNAKKETPKP